MSFSWLARNCRKRIEGMSADCRSSSTTRSGRARAALRSIAAVESNSWNRADLDGASGGGGRDGNRSRSSGRICATSAAPAPMCCRSSSAGVDRTRLRSAWTQSQNGGAPASSQPRPQRTWCLRSRALAASSSARRLLPIPGSPPRRIRRPWPSAASASASTSSWSSRSRPAKTAPDWSWATVLAYPCTT